MWELQLEARQWFGKGTMTTGIRVTGEMGKKEMVVVRLAGLDSFDTAGERVVGVMDDTQISSLLNHVQREADPRLPWLGHNLPCGQDGTRWLIKPTRFIWSGGEGKGEEAGKTSWKDPSCSSQSPPQRQQGGPSLRAPGDTGSRHHPYCLH